MGLWSKIGNAILIAIAGYEVGSNVKDTQKFTEIKTNDEELWQITTIVIIIVIIIICILKLNAHYKNYVNKKINNNVV